MEFSDFENNLIEALDDCRGAIKHCSKNAIKHLEKSWKIRKIDMEMAIFRGITAEEEATSALFYCLKNHQYKNANQLLFKEHTHKLSAFPFIQGIGNFLSSFLSQESSPFGDFQIKFTEISNRKAIELSVNIPAENITATPTPPLHFVITNQETGKPRTFEDDFKKLISGESYTDILKYIKDKATTRNELLYANNQGRPKVEGDIELYLNNQKSKVMILLIITLMIDPWERKEGKSLFVQQALNSFLLLLKRIDESELSELTK